MQECVLSVENLIKAILDIFRTHNILLYVVCIASGLLSYNVLGVAELTGYASVKNDYKNYIGMIFFVSSITITVLLIKTVITFLKDFIISSDSDRKSRKIIENKIVNLTNQEKAVLLQFFIQQSETIWLPFRAQEVVELINSGVISLASNAARMTSVGEAAMLNLPMCRMQELASIHPEIYSEEYDKNLVDNLVNHSTPNSVREVVRNRQLHNY